MIPPNITRQHIIQAIEEIKRDGVPGRRMSRKFLLEFRGQYYPPKYVISLANKYANRRLLPPHVFYGGGEANAFLQALGFKIVRTRDITPRRHLKEDARQKARIAEHFVRCYVAAREGLTELGILRSERSLQTDYSEWLAAEMLGLRLASSKAHKGFDGKDAHGNTYQIKSRLVRNLGEKTSFDFRNIEMKFDYLVCVFFSPSFDLLAMIRVPYDVVRELGVQAKSSFRFRWNRRTAQDKRIEWIYGGVGGV